MSDGIVIVGGGVIGSAAAYFLAVAGAAADVVVVEPDLTYAQAATPRAVGGVRLQHAIPENVDMSLFGDTVYSAFDQHVTGGDVRYDPQFYRMGFLFCVAGAAAIARLRGMADMLAGRGIAVQLLDRSALRERYPSFRWDDVDAATLTPDDGQIDPHAALMGFRRAAEGRGIRYRRDRVVALEVAGGRVAAARLESGETIVVDTLINAANCWAAPVAAMAGVALPVEPLRRQTFQFDCQASIEPIPAIRFASGFATRRLRQGFITGFTAPDETPGFNWEIDHDAFEQRLWPALAERSPAFEAVKARGGWVGHYDMCRLDGNMVLGRIPALPNMIVAAGFSGHGLQHAPAVGRSIAELILQGGYRSIDLARFGYERVAAGRPLADAGPTA